MSKICGDSTSVLRPVVTRQHLSACTCSVVPHSARKPFRQNPCPRRNFTVCYAKKKRTLIQSDGQEHLGSALDQTTLRDFPGPSGRKGPPLRVLPIGGLGEIGMNCMLVGVYERYILIDAGLMFPDFSDVGMQKILPDTSFIAQWKDRIEAVVITHGHEDHIGAIPWVFPALDPSTPIYTSTFVRHLLKHRLKQFNLWDENRFLTFDMNKPFKLGPFECEALRVTHSIPDCCGLVFRSRHGTILHTGDWKIDENPLDGRIFDRETFEKLSKEHVTLMMSDSTNVLSPGRSLSESTVREALINKVSDYNGQGRVVATLFASNLHRLGSLKKAADASGRQLCFVGRSLESYLSAAVSSGDAPFHPRELIEITDLDDIDPSKVLVVTTGSQAEPMSALSLASIDSSEKLKLSPDDVVLYSAKIIPGNEKRVMRMMNRISKMGLRIEMDKADNLHSSGHGYREELAEVIKLVQPQHFLPIHGESVFLHAHAELAKELGIKKTSVIHDGEMLGVKSLRNGKTVSSGSMQLLGDVQLKQYYNDGNKGTGTYEEMAIHQRVRFGTNGIVVVSVDVMRPPRVLEYVQNRRSDEVSEKLKARVRLTVRGMWTNKGDFVRQMFKLAHKTIANCSIDASCVTIERAVSTTLRKSCRKFNRILPDVVVVVHEHDPRIAAAITAANKPEEQRPIRRAIAEGNLLTETQSKGQATSKTRGRPRSGRRKVPRQIPLPTPVTESEEEPEAEEASMEELLVRSPNGVVDDGLELTEAASAPVPEAEAAERTTEVKTRKKSGRKRSTSTTGKRRGRPPKKKPEQEESPGELIPVPEGLLEERRQRNPREQPVPGVDLDYG